MKSSYILGRVFEYVMDANS